MATPANEYQILGIDGMNRADPTPFVRGESGSPWPMLEVVNVDVAELPVIQGRLAFRDAFSSANTTFPRQRYGL